MATKNTSGETTNQASGVSQEALLQALNDLPPDVLSQLLSAKGLTPSVQGITPEVLATILQTSGAASAKAMQMSLRVENPNFPERSVFLPRGKFDDDGTPEAPKLTLRYDTYFCGVLIGMAGGPTDLSTESEIELFNRFESDKESRDGDWSATLTRKGNNRMRLDVKVPCKTNDDRMGLPTLELILLELLEGVDATNTLNLVDKVRQLERELAEMRQREASPLAAVDPVGPLSMEQMEQVVADAAAT